ncbi:hypothetical protein GCM10028810_53810 [Spirosoma litoris]
MFKLFVLNIFMVGNIVGINLLIPLRKREMPIFNLLNGTVSQKDSAVPHIFMPRSDID